MKKNITQMTNNDFSFDIALSFAGEDRKYVEQVAQFLTEMGFRVFYDKYEKVSLWGKDLYVHLQDIYQDKSRFTVMFISKHYADRLWTNHERQSAQARAFRENREYILPARFDDTRIPGLMETIGYIDLHDVSPKQLAELIKQKVGPIPRCEFFPAHPDRLFEEMKITSRKKRESVSGIALSFFEDLKLMTPKERLVLSEVFQHTCPAGPPENVHIRIDYLTRLTTLSRDKIISLFSRLDCLGIVATLSSTEKEDDTLCHSSEVLEVRYYESGAAIDEDNVTFVACGIFDCIYNHLCPKCATNALERLDFSILGKATGFSEK